MSARRSKEEVSSGESDSSSESDSYDVPDPYGDGQPSWHFLGERRAAKIVRDYLVQQAYSDRESAETSEPIEYRVKRFEHDEDPPSDWEFDDEDQVHRWLILAYGDAEAIVSFLDSVEGYILRRGSGDVSRFAGYTMDPYIQLAHIMGLGDWKRSEFKRSDAMTIFSDRVKEPLDIARRFVGLIDRTNVYALTRSDQETYDIEIWSPLEPEMSTTKAARCD